VSSAGAAISSQVRALSAALRALGIEFGVAAAVPERGASINFLELIERLLAHLQPRVETGRG
jgi:hypothetical protein